jgi:carbonic anhydrase
LCLYGRGIGIGSAFIILAVVGVNKEVRMRKLVEGVVDFRLNVRPTNRESFKRLAQRQTPDCLFIACADSRVAPNVFASSNPGDLFVVRNVGNLIPPSGFEGFSVSGESEAAAIEFSLLTLNVADIIICGHSDCGAMLALLNGREKLQAPHLSSWLRHSEDALEQLRRGHTLNASLSRQNQLSQLNVLNQVNNLLSYDVVRACVESGQTRIHGWWFVIGKAEVYNYNNKLGRFVVIDEAEAARVLERLEARRERLSAQAEQNSPLFPLQARSNA